MKRHPRVPETADGDGEGGELVMPLELCFRGIPPDGLGSRREQWLRDRGIDPTDRERVSSIVAASCRFHRLPDSSLDRAFVSAQGLVAWREWRRLR